MYWAKDIESCWNQGSYTELWKVHIYTHQIWKAPFLTTILDFYIPTRCTSELQTKFHQQTICFHLRTFLWRIKRRKKRKKEKRREQRNKSKLHSKCWENDKERNKFQFSTYFIKLLGFSVSLSHTWEWFLTKPSFPFLCTAPNAFLVYKLGSSSGFRLLFLL